MTESVDLRNADRMSRRAAVLENAREERLWVWALIFVALASLLFFFRLGDRSLGSSEGRWAEITREMQLSGNYFWPTINGEPYYDKPLLSYWLIDASSRLTGGLNELSVRLPSAMAGFVGVALLMLLARRLYDLRTGILAALVLATTHGYLSFSRLGSADMETATGVLAALALFVRNEAKPNGWWVVGLWLIMAVTSLTKGLLGFTLPLLVIGGYSLLGDGLHQLREDLLRGRAGRRLGWWVAKFRWLLNWKTAPGVFLALAVYFLPFAISSARMHSNSGLHMVFHENILRFLRPFDHQDPFYLYAYWILVLAAPWSIFLLGALVQMHANSRNKSDRFTLVYFWAIYIFFSLCGSRRAYYLLPLLPAVAVLVARLLVAPREALDWRARLLMNLGFLLLAMLVLFVGIIALLPAAALPRALSDFPVAIRPAVFVPFLLLMLGAVVYGFVDFRSAKIAFTSSVIAYSGLLFLFVFALPAVESFRGEKPFAQAVRKELNGDMDRLLLYKIWGPGLLFYLDAPKPVSIYSGSASLARVIEDNPGRWIVVKEPDIQSLPAGSSVALASQYFSWSKSPHVLDEYALLRPKSIAEHKARGSPEPSHRKAAREEIKNRGRGETVPGKGDQAPAA